MEQPGKVSFVRKALPYVGTLALLAYLYFNLKDEFVSDEFFNALRKANLPLLIAGTSFPFMAFYITHTIITARVFTWFVYPLKVRDIWSVRGATMMLKLINPALSGAAWIIYLIRKTGAPVTKILAMVALNIVSALSFFHIVVTGMMVTMWTGHYPVADNLRNGLTVYVILGWFWFFQTVTFWLLGWKWGPLNRIREWKIMELLNRAELRHWLHIAALVFPSFMAGLLGMYFCALAFDIVMPFHIFMGRFLRYIYFMFIPSVGGVGPLTVVWLKAYDGIATKETIVACTLAMLLVGHITRMVVGLICLLPAIREITALNVAADLKKQEAAENEESEMAQEAV